MMGFASVSSDIHLMGCLLTTVLKSFKVKQKGAVYLNTLFVENDTCPAPGNV